MCLVGMDVMNSVLFREGVLRYFFNVGLIITADVQHITIPIKFFNFMCVEVCCACMCVVPLVCVRAKM